ncbi:ANTH domain-containing protein [Cantharellus anzutake]|uniref:ANTH domain-containing protein n=1 Tax=Cantharellus anzutake TaxID=1750568 RepID=UPI001904BC37|nr:ANTH domain-containing protein [Cantharellus anzutake]KAF8329537.1 ANTH domain-containing protein [Cantharellus anzutake]
MSFEKIVKLACKPKAAPPKPKYLDPIIAATYDEEGVISDVCRALGNRLREPNAIVVFKALLVVHTMLRNGATENILSYMAKFDPLGLHNVGQGHWEGYRAPENLARYASYLESRIRAFKDLKHDAIRVQSDSNRDHRVGLIDEDGFSYPGSGISRSKTIVGRKLRVMTVEKGLLRETKIVQSMIDTLIECKFYLDDLEDQLNIFALRLLVKDLLVLFQAGNEGVINVLESYFEMSHIDAETALDIYRKFCRQTERVVDYLSVAKKLQNLLNVPIPNLKHAPVSLVGALEEYLRDPNFEQNRVEYKANKATADGKQPQKIKEKTRPARNTAQPPPSTSPVAASSSSAPPPAPSKVEDFFASIETESPPTNHLQQQATFNPFVQRQLSLPSQMTGLPFGGGPTTIAQPQPTGLSQPYVQGQPFGPMINISPAGMPQPSDFLQPVSQPNFLRPQTTGSNPFRQSMLLPHNTGVPGFGGPSSPTNPFPRPASSMGLSAFGGNPMESPSFTTVSNTLFGESGQATPLSGTTGVGFGNQDKVNMARGISRPASTPIRSSTLFSPISGSVKSHQTGSRNPFGEPLPPPVPPVPKGPTLHQLAAGAWSFSHETSKGSPPATNPFPTTSSPAPFANTGTNEGLSASLKPQQTGAGLISSIASSFATDTTPRSFPLPQPASTSAVNANVNTSNPFPSSSSQLLSAPSPSLGPFAPTSAAPASAPSPSIASVQPQPTGFGGSAVRPFKPSSSFGASLLEKLPPIPSEPGTPMPSLATNGALPNVTGMPDSFGSFSTNTSPSIASQSPWSAPPTLNSTGGRFSPSPSTTLSPNTSGGVGLLGVGLRPQPTGSANPFRLSMAIGGNTRDFSGLSAVGSSSAGTGALSSQFGNSNRGGNLGPSHSGQVAPREQPQSLI